jgi:hypothetical protein
MKLPMTFGKSAKPIPDIKPDSIKTHIQEDEKKYVCEENIPGIEENLSPNDYSTILHRTWLDAGLMDPGDIMHYLTYTYRKISPCLQGIHSTDVLEAVKAYGEVLRHPELYWFTANVSMQSFFEKQLDRFLPKNEPLKSLLKKPESKKEYVSPHFCPPLPKDDFSDQVDEMLARRG